MRSSKNKAKFSYSSQIEETLKVIKAVERKLSDEIINCCGVEWSYSTHYKRGYQISGNYHSSPDLSKRFYLFISADSNSVTTRVELTTFFRGTRDDMETTTEDYKTFEKVSPIPPNSSYDAEAAKARKAAIKYIVKKIQSYYGSNAERFIMNIKEE